MPAAADDDRVVLRRRAVRRGPLDLRLPEGLAASRVDGLEDPVPSAADDPLRPFELRSIRLG